MACHRNSETINRTKIYEHASVKEVIRDDYQTQLVQEVNELQTKLK